MWIPFYTILNVSEATQLEAMILTRVSHQVQEVLGSIRPTVFDLLTIPEPSLEQRKCWLVYLDVTLRWNA